MAKPCVPNWRLAKFWQNLSSLAPVRHFPRNSLISIARPSWSPLISASPGLAKPSVSSQRTQGLYNSDTRFVQKTGAARSVSRRAEHAFPATLQRTALLISPESVRGTDIERMGRRRNARGCFHSAGFGCKRRSKNVPVKRPEGPIAAVQICTTKSAPIWKAIEATGSEGGCRAWRSTTRLDERISSMA